MLLVSVTLGVELLHQHQFVCMLVCLLIDWLVGYMVTRNPNCIKRIHMTIRQETSLRGV